jgi:hypothetical protein
MRKLIATLVVAALSTVLLAATSQAAPTEVNVRIEGRSETIFEGPIRVEDDGVRAASDDEPRSCSGVNKNDPENLVPRPTPTSASADAVGLIGETFDGKWYDEFDDYFITRWGPDEQSTAENAYWGVLVDDTYTAVGGCQYQLDEGDEVLWVYDAFKHKPILALFPEEAHYVSGPQPLTATTEVGKPIAVEVDSCADDEEDEPPALPGRAGSGPFENAEVGPVVTSAKGFEHVNTKSAATVKTDAQGKADITFAEPGWHRLKATVVSGGVENAIRSNRLDVCVTGGVATKALEGATSCSELPAADQVRGAPPILGEVAPPGQGTDGGTTNPGGGSPSDEGSQSKTSAPPAGSPATSVGLKVSVPELDRKLLAKGRLGLSWKVANAGPGVGKWTISSQTVGQKDAAWVTRASGVTKSRATISLPQGHAYRLRFAITDKSGRTSTVSLGRVRVPKAGHTEGR